MDENSDGISETGKQDTLPANMLASAPPITTLRKRFDEAREDPNNYRQKSQMCRDYVDGPKQLSPDVRATLAQRHQPPIYTNRIRPAVNGVLGVLEAAQTDPRAYPRNPDDEEASGVCTKVLRYIADESHFNETKMDVAENFLIEGTGAVMIEVEDAEPHMQIKATQIRWEEFYYDPYSRRNDFKDARYLGVAKWQDEAQVKENPAWAARLVEIGDPLGSVSFGIGTVGDATWQDRPINMGWIDRNRKRIMLVEEYAIVRGTWMRCVYVATGVLEYAVSPYLDDKRRPCCPIEATSCYVDRENGRYGFVSDMVPIQDEINASRSRSLHLMNSRKVQNVDPTAPPVNVETVRAEAAKADGVIPMGWQEIPSTEMTMANMDRMREAKSEIERMGPTPAVLGRQEGASQSGRARLVTQQAGLTELARPLARLSDWELRCYRQMWWRSKQYWPNEMYIRVTDELQAAEFLKVNEPITVRQAIEAAMQGDQSALQAIAPLLPPQILQGAQQGNPQAQAMLAQVALQFGQQPIMVKNRLAELDMDIIIDSTPDTVNLQAEVFADFKELVASGIDPFSPQFELLIEMSPLEQKGKIMERLKAKREEIQQGQAQAQQQAAQEAERARQIGEQTAVADIANKQADTEKKLAEADQTKVETMLLPIKEGHASVPQGGARGAA